MIVTRYWIDGDDRPRVERVEWRSAADGTALTLPEPCEIDSAVRGPVVRVAVSGAAVAPADLASPGGRGYYELPLADGARIVSRSEFDSATAAWEAERDRRRAEVAAELAARQETGAAARLAALTEVVAAEVARQLPAAIAAALEDR